LQQGQPKKGRPDGDGAGQIGVSQGFCRIEDGTATISGGSIGESPILHCSRQILNCVMLELGCSNWPRCRH
jgi:hypothetical protein